MPIVLHPYLTRKMFILNINENDYQLNKKIINIYTLCVSCSYIYHEVQLSKDSHIILAENIILFSFN